MIGLNMTWMAWYTRKGRHGRGGKKMRWRQESKRRRERARVVVLLPAPFAPSSLINGELGFLISNTPLGLAVSSLLLADNGDVEGCLVDANYCELRGFNLNLEHHWRRWRRRSTLRPEIEIDTCLPRAADRVHHSKELPTDILIEPTFIRV